LDPTAPGNRHLDIAVVEAVATVFQLTNHGEALNVTKAI
jgi:hypothetical protein